MPTLFHPVAFSLLLLLQLSTQLDYCSSQCADYTNACYGIGSDECYACSTTLFNLSSQNGACIESSQREVKHYELQTNAMDISGYTSSKSSTATCGQYTLSGQYVSGDYIGKIFSGLGTNHYQLVIRMGVGFVGAWTATDQIDVKIEGVSHLLNYSCYVTSNECSSAGTDCFKILSFTVDHFTENATFEVSSLISETDPSVKYWGLKDIIVGVKTCHSSCLTCTGALYSDCLTCAEGFFLLGNVCVSKCDKFSIVDLRICSSQCPMGYYESGNLCKNCGNDCLSCSNSYSCLINSDGTTNQSTWDKNFLFWIGLIVLGFFTFFYLLWTLVIKKFIDSKAIEDTGLEASIVENENVNSGGSNEEQRSRGGSKNDQSSHQQIKDSWVSELPTVEQIVISNPKRRKRRTRDLVDEVAEQDLTFTYENNRL